MNIEKGKHVLFTEQAQEFFALTDRHYEVINYTIETPSPNIQDAGIAKITVLVNEDERELLSINDRIGVINSLIKEVV